ncbi:MAG: ferritin [Bacteroidia bacterium]|nr:ferritin [Bacteroidia bacterium]
MISKKIEKALNRQIKLEGESSHYYLAMASWCEVNGFNGISKFLYKHSDEERMHMLKLFMYVNERGGHAITPELKSPQSNFKGVPEIFQHILEHEVMVSKEINELVEQCLSEKDYTTHNFLQWYVTEQMEEERLARNILDKLNLIGNDKSGMYMFDRDLESMKTEDGAE